MSQYCIKSSSPLSSILISIPSPSAPFSPRMRRYFTRTGWIRIMTRYTCGFCLDWVTAEKTGSPYTTDLRRSSKSSGFRSSSSLTKMDCRVLREVWAQEHMDCPSPRRRWRPGIQEGPNEIRSLLCMTQEMKTPKISDQDDPDHGLRCHVLTLPRDHSLKLDHQPERLQERQKRRPLMLHLPNRQNHRIGGVG